MNEHQIYCFLMAAEENNFTKAAERLYITQPAISKVIGSLESELGVKLFLRSNNKRIELTEAGRLYRDVFTKMRYEMDAVRKTINSIEESGPQTVRFAYASRWSSNHFLDKLFDAVHAEHPNLTVEVECLEFQSIVDDLKEGCLDLGLCLSDYFDDNGADGIECEQVALIKWHIVYSDAFVQKNGPVSSLADFSKAAFFIADSERNRKTPDRIYQHFTRYGFIPRIEYLRNWDSVIAKVESGQGVVIFDEWAQHLHMKGFHHIDTSSHHSVTLAWNKSTPPEVARCFVRALKRYAG